MEHKSYPPEMYTFNASQSTSQDGIVLLTRGGARHTFTVPQINIQYVCADNWCLCWFTVDGVIIVCRQSRLGQQCQGE